MTSGSGRYQVGSVRQSQ